MSKRSSRSSSNLEKNNKKTIQNDNIIEEKIVKKQHITSKTSTITSISPCEQKSSAKEPVKMTLKELKNIKNIRKKQEHILMNIENDNIQKHVQGLIEKFDPPNCINCPKRRADKVCINKECGVDRYMQIICGKCHFDEQQKCITKPEIDIEEYFIKLATFINQQKYDNKQANKAQRIDFDNLETIFDDIDSLRNILSALRSKILNEIEGYISPQEMHGLLQNSITKALSLCEYDNIQEQLINVKKAVIFEGNKFHWNDANEKFKSLQKIFTNLDQTAIQTNKKISQSFVDRNGISINLNEKKFLVSKSLSYQVSLQPIQGKDDMIKINSQGMNAQYYMDFKLDKSKKYKLRFRFESQPTPYIMIGIMPLSMVDISWVYGVQNQYFCKRFLSCSPQQECSRIIKGSDLSNIPKNGMQIEMRIDFKNNYMDFYDFPEIENINANHKSQKFIGSDYVIAFCFFRPQTIVVESFYEVFSVDALE